MTYFLINKLTKMKTIIHVTEENLPKITEIIATFTPVIDRQIIEMYLSVGRFKDQDPESIENIAKYLKVREDYIKIIIGTFITKYL